MSATTSPPLAAARRSVLTALLTAMSAVFVAFLVTGVAMPALPLHVHRGLGLGTFAVGLVAGTQFVASLVSRIWAGHHADTRGAKRAVVAGLLATAAAGLLYLLSLRFVATPVASAAILLLGRAVLGGAESFVITGALGWGLALAGPGNTGKVMAWLGTAMYGAFAAGAPAGGALYAAYGFSAIALATTLVPLAALPMMARLPAIAPPRGRDRPAFGRVAGAVWVPGLGLAFSSLGFGVVMTFAVLLFAQRGWERGWLAVSAFAAAFMLARILFGHLPDRLGGAK